MKRLLTLVFSLGLFACGLLASEDYSGQNRLQGLCADGSCSTGVCSTGTCTTGNCNPYSTGLTSSTQIYYSTSQPMASQYASLSQSTPVNYPASNYQTGYGNVQYSNAQYQNVQYATPTTYQQTANYPQTVNYPSVQYSNQAYYPQPVQYSQSCNQVYPAGQVQYSSVPVQYSTVQSYPDVQPQTYSQTYASSNVVTPISSVPTNTYASSVPMESVSQPYINQSYSGQAYPSQPYVGQTYASQPYVNQTYPSQTYASQTYTSASPAVTNYQPSYTTASYSQPSYSSASNGTYTSSNSTGGYATSGLAQQKAVQAANMRIRGHVGGGLGGARYEGVGWSNQSPDAAVRNCCYWGTRPTSQIGVSRSPDGCWYACVLYR